jgi:acyl carrier protein
MSIENRVKRCIADQADCSTSDLDTDTSLESNLGFDTLDFGELLMSLDEEFDSFLGGGGF